MIAELIGLNLQSSIDRKLDSIDQTTYRFIFLQSSNSAQTLLKRIRVQVKHSYIRKTLKRFYKFFREKKVCLLLYLGFCTQKLSKDLVAHIAVCVNLLWDLWRAFLHINLGFSRRRSFLHLDDHSSCCHWSLKKHKRCACIWWWIQERRSPWIRSLRGRVSKFYWWVAIRSWAWGLVSLIVWTSILSR